MEKSHLGLLCDIGELNALFAGSDNIEAFLQQIVVMVTKHITADVCSIYLYDEISEALTLKATIGLNPASVNHTKLKLGEGLVGYAVENMTTVCEKFASENPHFKMIPGLDEERFESFLAVPISRGKERIGALVVQREINCPFDNNDELALKAITSQLAGVIENTRLLIDLHQQHEKPDVPVGGDAKASYKLIRGEVASEGLAIAPALVHQGGKPCMPPPKSADGEAYSLDDFRSAVSATEKQLEGLQTQVEEKVSGLASLIFSSHILMLKDTEFTGAMITMIENGAPPPDAIAAVADRYVEMFTRSDNPYTAEKARDVEDVARRLINNLTNQDCDIGTGLSDAIIIADELYPSDMLKLSSECVQGVILVSGGVTSHLSILARSLQIPLLIADNKGLLKIPDRTLIILDAEFGNIYVNPPKKILRGYRERLEAISQPAHKDTTVRPTTESADGIRISLLANINLLLDLKLAADLKSEGIGLYRTEFPFMIRSSFPTEAEQVIVYSTIMNEMKGRPINIRTLDIGGDKVLAYYDANRENNPALGMRSVRFTLSHPDIFQHQIRAILRAGVNVKDLRITFPMISSLDEFRDAKCQVLDCIRALADADVPHNDRPKIGIMVETPSIVEIIDSLAEESDFFCIGTNDFIQFMLAVDRTNAMVASYYIPHHPAILRSLHKVVAAALAHGKDVSICGEMAHEDKYIPFFLGIGVRVLSIDPRYMPKVQRIVAETDIGDARALAEAVMRETTIGGIDRILNSSLSARAANS